MTGSGYSPIAQGPIDSCRGRQRRNTPVLYLNLTKKNINVFLIKNKTVRNKTPPSKRI